MTSCTLDHTTKTLNHTTKTLDHTTKTLDHISDENILKIYKQNQILESSSLSVVSNMLSTSFKNTIQIMKISQFLIDFLVGMQLLRKGMFLYPIKDNLRNAIF